MGENLLFSITNWKKPLIIAFTLSPIQYIILTSIAMFFYAGGTISDPSNQGFFFWGNFFSDLGRLVAPSGNSNLISFVIFTISALFLSIMLAIFVLLFPKFFSNKEPSYKFIILGTISGVSATIFLLLTVLTPWDVFNDIHLVFATLFNISGIFVAIFFAIGIRKNKNYPNFYGNIYLLLVLLAIIYVGLTFAAPLFSTSEKVIIQASYQKISQYTMMICFVIQGYGVFKLANNEKLEM
ncbi:MAG: hypothetical protein GF317_13005 [Candidatus Lokiarchaeota archaeon]|nr:hypothetical protein [Candidatus Lokiarchaeota archaeon]MBD3200560.1 hypothetical protein [Candidatus Lokiarchaeota archaeon]